MKLEPASLQMRLSSERLSKLTKSFLVIFNIYRKEEHADIVLEKLSKWSGTVKAARTWESFNVTDEVVFSEPKYYFCYSFFMTQPNGKGTCQGRFRLPVRAVGKSHNRDHCRACSLSRNRRSGFPSQESDTAHQPNLAFAYLHKAQPYL